MKWIATFSKVLKVRPLPKAMLLEVNDWLPYIPIPSLCSWGILMNVRFYKYVTEVTLIKLKYYAGLLFIICSRWGFLGFPVFTKELHPWVLWKLLQICRLVEVESDSMTSNQWSSLLNLGVRVCNIIGHLPLSRFPVGQLDTKLQHFRHLGIDGTTLSLLPTCKRESQGHNVGICENEYDDWLSGLCLGCTP